jgi:hypothetical protein
MGHLKRHPYYLIRHIIVRTFYSAGRCKSDVTFITALVGFGIAESWQITISGSFFSKDFASVFRRI